MLTEDQLIQVNHACNQFEKGWRNGQQPRVESFLDHVSDRDLSVLVRELLPIEADYRRQSDEPLSIRECLTRFPDADEAWLREIVETGTVTQDDSPLPDTGEQIGAVENYQLLEQIGEGGFGIVYRAEQLQPVRRMVALKVMKPGMDSKQIVARFDAERQALAIMDHPNIASVYDAGMTNTGRPYFVMELVRGIPITDYCDQCKLTVPERLRLFVQVCQAVQHAHQKGVIHRDIKPTNVLIAIIDGGPSPKLIDFGVAKAINQKLTEHTLRTGFAQMLGTPLYMSPEQAEMSVLDVDTRSDIYALGVLLYELMTGSTPIEKTRLEKASFDELRRLIREDEPPLPSSRLSTLHAVDSNTLADQRRIDPRRFVSALRGDLDWIIMKAMEKDRTRRYDSASSLAKDVLRHLQDLPVQAGPPKLNYRIAKFAKRNRRVLGAVAGCSLVVGCAIAIGIWQSATVSQARRESDNARRQTQAVADFLVETFRSPDPSVDGRHVTIAEILDRAVEDLPGKFPSDSENKARMLHALGETYLGMGLPTRAVEVLQQARLIRQRVLGESHAETLASGESLAKAFQLAGNDVQAIQVAEEAADVGTANVEFNPVALQQILAKSYSRTGDFAVSVELLKQVYASRLDSLGALHPETLTAMSDLSSALKNASRMGEAIPIYQESIRKQEELLGAEHPQTLTSRFHLALAYSETGRQEQGLRMQREVLEARKRKLAAGHPATIQSMHSLAHSLSRMGRSEESIATYKEIIASPKVSRTMRRAALNNLGFVHSSRGETDESIGYWTQVVATATGDEQTERGHLIVLFNLGSAHGLKRQWSQAAKYYEQLLENESDLSNDRATNAMLRLGTIYAWLGDADSLHHYAKTMLDRIEEPVDSSVTDCLSRPFLICTTEIAPDVFRRLTDFGIRCKIRGSDASRYSSLVNGLAAFRLGQTELASRKTRISRRDQSWFPVARSPSAILPFLSNRREIPMRHKGCLTRPMPWRSGCPSQRTRISGSDGKTNCCVCSPGAKRNVWSWKTSDATGTGSSLARRLDFRYFISTQAH